MPPFIPGLELSRRFYGDIVTPILKAYLPTLRYAAALIGSGSEVLGFDTEMSTDHSWGPRVQLFLRDEDEQVAEEIDSLLRQHLPATFLGYPARFLPVPGEPRSVVPAAESEAESHHLLSITTLRQYVYLYLGLELGTAPEVADWLTVPSQKLRAFTAGAVFEDMSGDLTAFRQQLAWYPHDVWLYLLASGWTRIAQEEHLMPRAGYVGDELGSALIGSRLVRDVMSLCFLMERQYAPYAKWFGSAFRQLKCASLLTPLLWQAQQSATWQARMEDLAAIYRHLATMHNQLAITPPIATDPVPFHERPFMVSPADEIISAFVTAISDPALQPLTTERLIGNIDQFSDSTDLREDVRYRETLKRLFSSPYKQSY